MSALDSVSSPVLARVCTAYAALLAGNALTALSGWDAPAWTVAPQVAHVLGVGPLLYAGLHNASGWGTLPESFRTALARQYEMNSQRVVVMRREESEIRAAFDACAVPMIPLKGIALQNEHYPDPAVRPLADIDVLIRPEDLSRAAEALRSLGYLMEAQGAKPNFVRPDNRFPVALDVEHPDNPRRVEVHTRLEDEFRGTTIDWTDRVWSTRTNGSQLALPVLWAHLLSHTSRDIMTCRVRLIQLHDLALVARALTTRGAWSALPVSLDGNTARFWYPALALTRRYYAPDIPDGFCRRVASAVPPRLRAWCDRQTLFDVSWLGGNHLGVLETLSLWARTPDEMALLARVMWARRRLHLAHRFPHLADSRRAWLAYPAYAWDRLRGGPQAKKKRGRWDFSNPNEHHGELT